MIIGIDGNEANERERVGVHQYTFEILWALYKLQDRENTHLCFLIYLKCPPSSDFPEEGPFWKYKVISGSKFWVLTRLTPLLLAKKIDVFWSPNHYLPPIASMPRVCTIHDLGYLNFSGHFKRRDLWQLKYWSAISIIISKYIICPSRSVYNDIVRHYPFARNKVKIIHHGYDKRKYKTTYSKKLVRRIFEKYRITKKYILFLSTFKPSKNIEGLLSAFNLVKKDFDYQLVIVGKKGWLYDSIFEKVKELGLEEQVIFTDYVAEEDKPALIAGAKVFVLPSFWEGFGMDVLNVLASGIPIVLSNVGSLPEVAGKAGIYVDPKSYESIAGGIKKVLDMDQKGYNKQVQLGLKQVQKYSWERSARETLNVLKGASGIKI